jgi:hypothetical protein
VIRAPGSQLENFRCLLFCPDLTRKGRSDPSCVFTAWAAVDLTSLVTFLSSAGKRKAWTEGRSCGGGEEEAMGEFSKVRRFLRSCCYLLTYILTMYLLLNDNCTEGDPEQLNLPRDAWSIDLTDRNVSRAEMKKIILWSMINIFLSVKLVHSIPLE